MKPFTVNLAGFSLNAAVACSAGSREPLERLCCYVTRPAEPRMSDSFVDTNVVLYRLDDGPKGDRAEALLLQGPRVSVQVLDEAMVDCRRRAGLSWEETGALLSGIAALCPVEDLTLHTHEVGHALATPNGPATTSSASLSTPPPQAYAARPE